MDDKKALGVVMALGRSMGETARTDAALLPALRAVADVAAYRALLLAHRGALPEALVAAYADSVAPERLVKERARLVLQVKLVAAGGEHVSPDDARKGPVKHR